MPLAEKTIEDVLLHFSETKRVAIKRHREFVEKGIKQGTREDLQGGGLVRSAGGDATGLLGRKEEEREKGDARILGSGEFVNATLQQSESDLEKKYLPKRPIADFIESVAVQKGISPGLIRSNCRQRKLSEARALVAYLPVEEGSHTLTEVGRYLTMKHSSVSYAVGSGEKGPDTFRIFVSS